MSAADLAREYATVKAARESAGIYPEGTVLVRFDRVYGQIKCYPVNDAAQLICQFTGTKTLTHSNLETARKLGLQVNAVSTGFPEGWK